MREARSTRISVVSVHLTGVPLQPLLPVEHVFFEILDMM